MLRISKHVRGRKTDVIDAQWIAEVLSSGLLRPSFVPPAAVSGAAGPDLVSSVADSGAYQRGEPAAQGA